MDDNAQKNNTNESAKTEPELEPQLTPEQIAANELVAKIIISKTFVFPPPESFTKDDFHLIYYPNPRLKKKSTYNPMNMDKDRLKELTDRLNELMLELDGIGLAAPQVGWQARVISMRTTEGPKIMINPKIISKDSLVESAEACLSFPEIDGYVKRYNYITIEHLDIDGGLHTVELNGLASSIVQHEIDHLEGRLFLDRLSSTRRFEERRAIKNLEELWTIDAERVLAAEQAFLAKEEREKAEQSQEVKT